MENKKKPDMAELERQKIVLWLRDKNKHGTMLLVAAAWFAREIEKKAHHER